MKTEIKINGHLWCFHKETETINMFGGEWSSSDGDLVEIYIEKDKSGFEIHGLFSGMPASKIFIDEIDIPTIIRHVMKCEYDNKLSFEEQCCMCADHICSKFMEYVDLKKFKTV